MAARRAASERTDGGAGGGVGLWLNRAGARFGCVARGEAASSDATDGRGAGAVAAYSLSGGEAPAFLLYVALFTGRRRVSSVVALEHRSRAVSLAAELAMVQHTAGSATEADTPRMVAKA